MDNQTVIILAGGPSVAEYNISDLHKRGYVIGINDAAYHEKTHAVLSMDRLWFENRFDWLVDNPDLHKFIRRSILRKETEARLHEIKNLNLFDCDYESTKMLKETGTLNGTSSGMCGLNLGYQIGPRTLYLLGYDVCKSPDGKPYWYPEYTWAKRKGGDTGDGTYRKWAKQFDACQLGFIHSGIKIRNVNHRSAIAAFPKISYDEFLKETNYG